MKPLVNDTIAGFILGPDGAPVYKPATALSQDEAKILRAIDRIGGDRKLHIEILCSSCWNDNPQKIMACDIAPSEIHLICDHRQLFYLGETPLATRDLNLDDTISYDEARILRMFDKVLGTHGLLAAYYCHVCDENDQHGGMRVAITDNSIDMQCRHRILRHRGQSY